MDTTSFDIVMERAFDDNMNRKMTTAFQKGKEAGNSNYMRTANTCLNEARRLLKQGDIREAKAKYKESLDNILAAIQIVTESYNDLEHSGEGKKRIGFKQFGIIASFIAYIIIICITGSKIATSDMSPSSTAISTAAGIGGGTAGYLGILNIIKNWKNKDDKINYDKFKSQFQDDPKSTLRVVLKSLNQTYNQIHREMIRECK